MALTFEQAKQKLLDSGELNEKGVMMLVPASTYSQIVVVQGWNDLWKEFCGDERCQPGQKPVLMKGSWGLIETWTNQRVQSQLGRDVFARYVSLNKLTITSLDAAWDLVRDFRRLCEARPEKRSTYDTRSNEGWWLRHVYMGRPGESEMVRIEGRREFIDPRDSHQDKKPRLLEPVTVPDKLPEEPVVERVYILSNPSMPGVVKIGKTTLTAEKRAEQLFNTGVPTPFQVEMEVIVESASLTERAMHEAFAHLRVTSKREYFSASNEQLGVMIETLKLHAKESSDD